MALDGVIIIDKEEGLTSQTAVNRVKRLLGISKAGHTGTLDPMATGVLPVLVGRGVKAAEYLLSGNKHYIATLRLGITTDSEDITGNVVSESSDIPDESAVLDAIRKFVGEVYQVPPMYSALKRNGQKLVDLARKGITVEREARPITVYRLDAEKIDERNYLLDVVCSKGTYIRTLCADIGAALGCGAVMATLRRAESAGYTLGDSITLVRLETLTEEERQSLVIPVDTLLSRYPAFRLSEFFSHLAKSGCEIYLRKIGLAADNGDMYRLYDHNGVFFALAEVRRFDDGLALKPIKQF